MIGYSNLFAQGENHYDAATAYHHLAIILKKQKRYEEAEQYALAPSISLQLLLHTLLTRFL